MKTIFLVISILAGFTSPVIGINSILRGNFRPHRMTRFLIFLVSLLFVGTLLAQGDHNGIFIAVAQFLGSAVIFYLSLKRGLGGWATTDKIVLVMSLLTIVVWKTTSDATLALLMSIVADVIGFSPTLVKTWKWPETEEWKFYMSDVVASFFSILSIATYGLATLAFPVYILLINTTSVVIILGRRRSLR